jgi:hypothetical protein
MVCDHLDVSDSPDEPGDTAIEAVCRLKNERDRILARLDALETAVTGSVVIMSEETGDYVCVIDPKLLAQSNEAEEDMTEPEKERLEDTEGHL